MTYLAEQRVNGVRFRGLAQPLLYAARRLINIRIKY